MNEFKKKRREKWKFTRLSKGIKLYEVANYVGVSISMISKYENCHRDMNSDSVELYEEYIQNN